MEGRIAETSKNGRQSRTSVEESQEKEREANQRFFLLEFTMGWERRRSRPALKLKEVWPQTRGKRASEVARSTAEVVEGRKEDWASPVLASTGRQE